MRAQDNTKEHPLQQVKHLATKKFIAKKQKFSPEAFSDEKNFVSRFVAQAPLLQVIF